MNPLNGRNLFHIIRRSLNFVDERLVGHGEQVAYIVLKLLEEDGSYDTRQRCGIIFTALLHDIGAYKTEEIDNMVRFETKDVQSHSIYGYLFVKYFSPFAQYASAVLLHHMDYQDFSEPSCRSEDQKLGQIFNLADRAALCGETQPANANQIMKKLKTYSGSKFSPAALDLLEKAEKRGPVLGRVDREKQTAELLSLLDSWTNEDEIDRFLQMLVFSIDFRSRYTVAHTFATAQISMDLARIFGMAGRDLQRVKYGAFLHDLGKVGIPLDILESPGRLSDSDMALMRSHILLSEKIIKGQIEEETALIALRHHEKMDGSGYPRGLGGEELTIAQRIVAIADIVSALNGERSYKRPFPPERVKSILREMAGSGKLCPMVTAAMLDHFNEIIEKVNSGSRKLYELYHHIEEEYRQILSKYPDFAEN
ncbi:HD domain-containing protein [Anaerovorax odorimutans]|uniref:HD domain-containing protein n=1 Tax=Anaerovorax odorimutans TaxID=109327 RepID=A0ABT1RQS9_9FIRM|nr:HD domain-containing phosphohydrolase [Anaerovorax odorimutans]MCQ4637548.1 HD domain-containing protein [Anaerovorax odorimutans]